MKKFNDNRGSLIFPFKNNEILKEITQCTVSKNKKNVFRGFHSNNFDKLVTCIHGKILDIIINLDEKSEDYLKPKYYELNPSTDNFQLFVPKNYAHGFLSLEEDTIVLYHFNGIFLNEDTKHIHYLDPYLNIKLPIQNIIISKNDSRSNFIKPIEYIILGATGYIGTKIYNIFKKQNKNIIILKERLENTDEIKKKLLLYKPKYVINSAGITGIPNISWCDINKVETIETNITHQLTLAKICKELNIHLTMIGSGGIFMGNKIKTENDKGDFFDNFYSEARIYLENLIKHYNNVLYLRVNYPISSDNNPKNLIIKLSKWNKICNTELSITCLDTLIPLLSQIIESNQKGIVNFVNPGRINLIELKKKYNEVKNINEKFEIIENKDRPCPILDTNIIEKYSPMNIKESLNICIKKFK
jgi:3,5-epimerase/4-reductase